MAKVDWHGQSQYIRFHQMICPTLETLRVRAFCFRVADASASPLVREGIATPWRLEIVSPYMPRSSAFNSRSP